MWAYRIRMATQLLPGIAAAHVASSSHFGRNPVQCKNEFEHFDDQMGQLPWFLRIAGRVAVGVALASTGGAVALFLIPAYDLAKCSFHVAIGRDDKALSDAISVATGAFAAGVSCGVEAHFANKAVEEAIKQASQDVAIESTKLATIESTKCGLVQSGNQSMVEATKISIVEAGKGSAVEVVTQQTCRVIESTVIVNNSILEATNHSAKTIASQSLTECLKSGSIESCKAATVVVYPEMIKVGAVEASKSAVVEATKTGMMEIVRQNITVIATEGAIQTVSVTGLMLKEGCTSAGAAVVTQTVTQVAVDTGAQTIATTLAAGITTGTAAAATPAVTQQASVVLTARACSSTCSGPADFERTVREGLQRAAQKFDMDVLKPSMQHREFPVKCSFECLHKAKLKSKGGPDCIIEYGSKKIILDMKHYTKSLIDTREVDKLLMDKQTFSGTHAAFVVLEGTKFTTAASAMMKQHQLFQVSLEHSVQEFAVSAFDRLLYTILSRVF